VLLCPETLGLSSYPSLVTPAPDHAQLSFLSPALVKSESATERELKAQSGRDSLESSNYIFSI